MDDVERLREIACEMLILTDKIESALTALSASRGPRNARRAVNFEKPTNALQNRHLKLVWSAPEEAEELPLVRGPR